MSRATTRIGSVVLGTGRPKLCVPLVGATFEALHAAAGDLSGWPADLVELRIDFFERLDDLDAVREAIDIVARRTHLPILFTVRTRAEGGSRDIPIDAYESLIDAAVATGAIAAVDVEQSAAAPVRDRIIAAVQASGLPVVLSSHDFVGTPSRDALLDRLAQQQALGADVLKVAVTPTSAQDVLTLLDASETFVRTLATRPVVAMSMGGLGLVSRLAGEVFGSAMTFGSAGAKSAPGQISADALADVLDLVHGELGG
jgi:3-dehydroquinate dehydratase I